MVPSDARFESGAEQHYLVNAADSLTSTKNFISWLHGLSSVDTGGPSSRGRMSAMLRCSLKRYMESTCRANESNMLNGAIKANTHANPSVMHLRPLIRTHPHPYVVTAMVVVIPMEPKRAQVVATLMASSNVGPPWPPRASFQMKRPRRTPTDKPTPAPNSETSFSIIPSQDNTNCNTTVLVIPKTAKETSAATRTCTTLVLLSYRWEHVQGKLFAVWPFGITLATMSVWMEGCWSSDFLPVVACFSLSQECKRQTPEHQKGSHLDLVGLDCPVITRPQSFSGWSVLRYLRAHCQSLN